MDCFTERTNCSEFNGRFFRCWGLNSYWTRDGDRYQVLEFALHLKFYNCDNIFVIVRLDIRNSSIWELGTLCVMVKLVFCSQFKVIIIEFLHVEPHNSSPICYDFIAFCILTYKDQSNNNFHHFGKAKIIPCGSLDVACLS